MLKLYEIKVKWYGDEEFEYYLIQSNTKKDAENIFRKNCRENEWSLDGAVYLIQKVEPEKDMYRIKF